MHGNTVECVKEKGEVFTNIDGLVTNKSGISLSLRFADCTPIFLYDRAKNVIGNIHSGWRGTVQKIGQKGVEKMVEEYGCNPKDIIACIGPAIGRCHFEVEEDVKEIFEETFSYLESPEKFIQKGKKAGKYFIDTNYINEKLLEEEGLIQENIIQSNICTVCNRDYMHSYRAEKELSGRNTSIIGIK